MTSLKMNVSDGFGNQSSIYATLGGLTSILPGKVVGMAILLTPMRCHIYENDPSEIFDDPLQFRSHNLIAIEVGTVCPGAVHVQ